MTLGKDGMIGPYRLTEDFRTGNNCRYAAAERDSHRFFVKEFYKPKYPPDSMTGEVRDTKLRRCRAFESRHKKLVTALGRVAAPGGNIVMPVDFFRFGLVYYHIAPLIDTATTSPVDIAAAPRREKLLLLRLLSRSLVTLHSQSIVHGDLKPPNVLIARPSSDILSPKIIDFDGAFFEGDPPHHDEMAFDQNYVAPEVVVYTQMATGGGTLRPETLGVAADVFSLGLLIHEFWTGQPPGLPPGVANASTAVLNGKPLGFMGRDLPGGIERLMRAATALSPKERPRIADIDAAIAAAVRSGLSEPPPEPPLPPAKPERAGVVIRMSENLRRPKPP